MYFKMQVPIDEGLPGQGCREFPKTAQSRSEVGRQFLSICPGQPSRSLGGATAFIGSPKFSLQAPARVPGQGKCRGVPRRSSHSGKIMPLPPLLSSQAGARICREPESLREHTLIAILKGTMCHAPYLCPPGGGMTQSLFTAENLRFGLVLETSQELLGRQL